jgi:hypothetical protein
MTYEMIREIFNLCSGNQMRDVFESEVETDNLDAYVKQYLVGKTVRCEKSVKARAARNRAAVTEKPRSGFLYSIFHYSPTVPYLLHPATRQRLISPTTGAQSSYRPNVPPFLLPNCSLGVSLLTIFSCGG